MVSVRCRCFEAVSADRMAIVKAQRSDAELRMEVYHNCSGDWRLCI